MVLIGSQMVRLICYVVLMAWISGCSGYGSADRPPTYSLENIVADSKWIAVAQVEEMSSSDCVVNGRRARLAKLKITRIVKGKIGNEAMLSYFPESSSEFVRGKHYLVFNLPIVVNCVDVINTVGIVELRESIALTDKIYGEPQSQPLDALLSRIVSK
jgi:hypothetical protein